MKSNTISKRNAYLCLIASIIAEQFGTMCLEACRAFTKPVPTVGVVLGYAISFYLFAKVLNSINLSISYATWTALGTISAAVFGLVLFHQNISPIGWGAIILMCIGIVMLNLFGSPKESESDSEKPAAD